MENTTKPSTTFANASRANSAELWSTITTTWSGETRTWDQCASIVTNQTRVSPYTQVATATSYTSPTVAENIDATTLGYTDSSPWSDLSNVYSSNNSYTALAIATGKPNSDFLNVTGFGFSIPSDATITGITVQIERSDSDSMTRDSVLRLLKDGIQSGNNKAVYSFWTPTDTVITYGSSSDLWGTNLSPTDVNKSNFGVGFRVNRTRSAVLFNQIYIDHIQVKVHYLANTLQFANLPKP